MDMFPCQEKIYSLSEFFLVEKRDLTSLQDQDDHGDDGLDSDPEESDSFDPIRQNSDDEISDELPSSCYAPLPEVDCVTVPEKPVSKLERRSKESVEPQSIRKKPNTSLKMQNGGQDNKNTVITRTIRNRKSPKWLDGFCQ